MLFTTLRLSFRELESKSRIDSSTAKTFIVIGLAVINSSRVLCQKIVDKIIEEIESNYPVEIYQINEIE
jgi:uncharacterized protein YlxP (DUF503 family)